MQLLDVVDYVVTGLDMAGDPTAAFDPGDIVSDGDNGLLAGWTQLQPDNSGNYAFVKHIYDPSSAYGSVFPLPFYILENLITGNGTAYAMGECLSDTCTDNGLAAFDISSGTILWKYESSQEEVQMLAAMPDGSLLAKEGPYSDPVSGFFDDPTQVFQLDSSGNRAATFNSAGLSRIRFTDTGSWLGLTSGAVAVDSDSVISISSSGSAIPNGNLQRNVTPGYKLTGLQDYVENASQTVPSQIRHILYELHQKDTNGLPTDGVYTVYEYQTDNSRTQCPNDPGESPCGPAPQFPNQFPDTNWNAHNITSYSMQRFSYQKNNAPKYSMRFPVLRLQRTIADSCRTTLPMFLLRNDFHADNGNHNQGTLINGEIAPYMGKDSLYDGSIWHPYQWSSQWLQSDTSLTCERD